VLHVEAGDLRTEPLRGLVHLLLRLVFLRLLFRPVAVEMTFFHDHG
jgi:hypothetical protein